MELLADALVIVLAILFYIVVGAAMVFGFRYFLCEPKLPRPNVKVRR